MESFLFEAEPTRIDLRLTQQFPYSRNFFHHLISRGSILIQKKNMAQLGPQVIKKSYIVQPGDQVFIEKLTRFVDGTILDETPAWDIDVRHQTPDYAVIYKPKGILSHPTSLRELQTPSVVGGMRHYLHKQGLPSLGGRARAGLVHRLDKDTDGLMIIALSEKGLAHFKQLFMAKSTAQTLAEKEAVPLTKRYHARCHVLPMGETFLSTLASSLPTYIDQIVIPRVPHPGIHKRGITKIESFSYNDTKPIPEVEVVCAILTGRTHQIRYHLSQKGLPIIGDTLYGAPETGIPMALTAFQLVFLDPDGNTQNMTV